MTDQKLIKALMVCAMGMSSSLLENKTKEAAQAAGVPFELHAITTPEIARWDFQTNYVDIVVAAPYGVIVQDIDPVLFGMVEGEKLFQQILTAVQARDAAKK